MRRLRSEPTGLSYLSAGPDDAPLVLCLHGFPDIPRTWSKLTPDLLEAGYRVVSPWLPGYSPSSLAGPFDLRSVTETILRLVDELSPSDPVRVIGHDWGAIITQYAALLRPDRLRAAVLMAIPHLLAVGSNLERYPRQFSRSAYLGFFRLPRVPERFLRFGNYRYIERLWRAWSPGFDPGPDYFDELKLCLRSSMPAPLSYYRALFALKTLTEIRTLFSAGPIVVPTLYLHGERDGCMGPEMAEGQEQYFSALFESMKLAEAGHFLHLERPTEVNAAILDWLEAH